MKQEQFKEMCINAIDKLEEQGVRSIELGICSYLSDKGCCIIGHMMPDDETRREADMGSISGIFHLFESNFPWAQQFTKKQIKVLSQLQYQHDDPTSPLDFSIRNMRAIVGEL